DDDDHDGHDHDKHKDDDDDHEGHDDHDGHDGHEGHDHGIYDPHFWFDPIRVSMAVEVIKDELVKFDTTNQSSYESAASDYVQELEALDASVTAMIDTIPVENRKIITTHEALGYLEARYGVEVLTTIIPSLNSEDGITPQSLKKAIDVIEKNHIEVMFLEAESSSQYSEVIEQETGISLVSGLWVETLQENQSYVDWMNNNVTIIVDNLPKEVDDDHAGHDHDKHKDNDGDHDEHDHDDDDHDDDDHDDDDHDKKDK
ncbi:MAG: zinc ABC transporter substrate-binding protein, partial [SAR202 cluster bacterium]|nr:zinc ABC transporter substrate-binding protein [SAR202 cluster bacterium]